MTTYKFFYFIFIFLFLFISVGCTNSDNLTGNLVFDDEIKFRIDVLYSHTLQMKELSTNEILKIIELDVKELDQELAINSLIKLDQLENSFGIIVDDNLDQRISGLEKRMDEMMIIWVKEVE